MIAIGAALLCAAFSGGVIGFILGCHSKHCGDDGD